jgi:uncharacterized protein (UPF0303 family)
MSIDGDLERLALQERHLRFDQFGPDMAWRLGTKLRDLAIDRHAPVVIDISTHTMTLFHVSLDGAVPDNEGWVRRKRNVALRFSRSSYAIGRLLLRQETTLQQKYGLEDCDFAAHGGSVPICVTTAGVIGAVTVSGLPQRDDHNLVIEALASLIEADYHRIRLD